MTSHPPSPRPASPRRAPRRTGRSLAATALLVVVAVAGGCADDSAGTGAGAPGGDIRTVTIVMREMGYSPSLVHVHVNQTVRFRFVNKGTVRHEAVIGDEAAQLAAVQAMQAMDMSSSTTAPARSGSGASGRLSIEPGWHGRGRAALAAAAHPGMGLPNVVSVEAGQTGELTFAFAKTGRLIIGCHETGHYEAGMKGTIVVDP